MEQKAPVTRKTATAKDYTTAKQSAMSRVTETAFKQKSVVNQFITAEQIQFDARKLNVSKSSAAQQTISKLLYIHILCVLFFHCCI